MKNKTKYKRRIEWDKKPEWDKILGGLAFCLGAIFVIVLLFDTDGATTLLTFVMTLLLCKGFKFLTNGLGEGRRKHYTKLKKIK